MANQTMDAKTALRTILQRLRWDDQGGYPGRRAGKWDFVTTGMTATPEELDALFAYAGLVPDEIKSLGSCGSCASSVNGRERGYADLCGSCRRPQMSNFTKKVRKGR